MRDLVQFDRGQFTVTFEPDSQQSVKRRHVRDHAGGAGTDSVAQVHGGDHPVPRLEVLTYLNHLPSVASDQLIMWSLS